MNKYQEALDFVKKHLDSKYDLKKVEVLQELVDKEIPEKPFYDGVPTEDGEEVEIRVCPNCCETVNFIVNFPYCPYCGQKLLWGEEE